MSDQMGNLNTDRRDSGLKGVRSDIPFLFGDTDFGIKTGCSPRTPVCSVYLQTITIPLTFYLVRTCVRVLPSIDLCKRF